jgi:hypothetical protein
LEVSIDVFVNSQITPKHGTGNDGLALMPTAERLLLLGIILLEVSANGCRT